MVVFGFALELGKSTVEVINSPKNMMFILKVIIISQSEALILFVC